MNELLSDELRATLHERFDDVAATPALYERIQRRIAHRHRVRAVAALAMSVAVVVAVVALPGLLTGDELRIDQRPQELAGHPDATPATDPTHALFTTRGGGLVGVELADGTRTLLVPEPDHSANVIDLTVAAGSSLEDFTAIAFDDGSGPIGFVTYVRRDGGETLTSFTPNDGRLPGHSNRGHRTISPDGRWLAYHGNVGEDPGVGLASIDVTTGQIDTDGQQFIAGLAGPIGWTGPVSEPGDRSVMVHPPHAEDGFTATILERTRDGFDVIETVPVDLGPIEDPDRSTMRRHAFGSLLPGELEDTRFDVRLEHPEIEIGERARPSHAVLRYRGPDGQAQVRFEMVGRGGNTQFAAQARTALLISDGPTLDDGRDGEAWVIRASVDGDEVTLEPRGPLTRGIVSGALLSTPSTGEGPPTPDALPPLTWEPPADYRFTLRSQCGNRSDIGRYEIVVEDGRTASIETSLRSGGEPGRLAFMSAYDAEAPTLVELYDEARTATEAGADHVEVTTEPETGRPIRLDIDWNAGATDDEACFIVSDYSPINR